MKWIWVEKARRISCSRCHFIVKKIFLVCPGCGGKAEDLIDWETWWNQEKAEVKE